MPLNINPESPKLDKDKETVLDQSTPSNTDILQITGNEDWSSTVQFKLFDTESSPNRHTTSNTDILQTPEEDDWGTAPPYIPSDEEIYSDPLFSSPPHRYTSDTAFSFYHSQQQGFDSPSDEVNTWTHSSTTHPSAPVTLDDGNCAFNAFAQAITDLMINGNHEIIKTMHQYLHAPHLAEDERIAIVGDGILTNLLEETLTEEICEEFCALLSSVDSASQQRALAPLLRHKAIREIETPEVYAASWREGYEQRLQTAYDAWLWSEQLADPFLVTVFNRIISKFIHDLDCDETALQDWWHTEGRGISQEKCYQESACIIRFKRWADWFENNFFLIMQTWTNKKNLEDSALLAAFPFISNKLSDPHVRQDHLICWWESEGKAEYFDAMRYPASNATETHKWGSDNELNVLACDFGLNLRVINEGHSCMVGKAAGIIEESVLTAQTGTDNVEQLLDFAVAERLTMGDQNLQAVNYLRFLDDAFEKLTLYSIPQPEHCATMVNLLCDLQEQGVFDDQSVPQYIITQFKRNDIISFLQFRGILSENQKLITSGQTHQLPDGRTIALPDRVRISRMLNGISPESAQYIQSKIEANVEADVTLTFNFNHWTYTPNSEMPENSTSPDNSLDFQNARKRSTMSDVPEIEIELESKPQFQHHQHLMDGLLGFFKSIYEEKEEDQNMESKRHRPD